MSTRFYIRITAFTLLFCIACKHKQKQVTGIKKEVVKKQEVKPKQHGGNKAPSGNSPLISNDLQQKLGLSSREIKENKLYSFINEWYGVPYKYGGCQKTGVDCSCFTNILYEKIYSKKISRSAAEKYNQCDKISYEDAKEGDLFFFKIGGNSVTHVGVFLKNKYFVHSSTSKGVIINNLEEAYYKKYFFCAGKMKSV